MVSIACFLSSPMTRLAGTFWIRCAGRRSCGAGSSTAALAEAAAYSRPIRIPNAPETSDGIEVDKHEALEIGLGTTLTF
jgi:hypothetical protein